MEGDNAPAMDAAMDAAMMEAPAMEPAPAQPKQEEKKEKKPEADENTNLLGAGAMFGGDDGSDNTVTRKPVREPCCCCLC